MDKAALRDQGLSIQLHNMTYTCLMVENVRESGGLFYGDNPLKKTLVVFLGLAALGQVTNHIIYFLLKPLKQPKFVCSLLGGIILGPTFLGRNKSYMSMLFPMREQILLDVTSNLGVIYFLFLTIAKMDTALTVRTMKKNGWSIGISCFALPLFVVIIIFGFLDHFFSNMHDHVPYMVMSYTLSHFPSVAHVIEELDLLSSDIGQLALSASAVNEVISWVGVLAGMIMHTGDLVISLCIFLSAMFIILVTFFVIRPFLKRVSSRTSEGKPMDEAYITGILLGVLLLVFLTDSLGMVLAGAIIFGLAIPNGPPLAMTLVDKSEAFIMDFLMPLFYLYVGLHTDISAIKDWNTTMLFFLVTMLATLLKVMGAFLPAVMYYKIKARQAFLLGIALNFRGVIELIIIRRWKESKVIDEEWYTIMVVSFLVITAVMVPLFEGIYNAQANADVLPIKDLIAIQKGSDRAELRVLACVRGEEDVNSLITILEASNTSKASPICALVAHLVKLAGRSAPVVVHYNSHKKMLRSQSSDQIMRAFDNYSKSSEGSVHVKPFTIIAPYKSMHENICKLARDESAHLIIIPFRKIQEGDFRSIVSLKNLNTNVQSFAQCTVGVLVDKGFPRCSRNIRFSYDIAVIFLGGPDDREALAFATRMSGRAGIRMSVIRIILNRPIDEDDKNQGQKKLDTAILGEFEMKNITNQNASYSEMVAEDGIQVIHIIKSLDLGYDLVIMGRRPGSRSLFSEGMMHFSESPELGVIGDFLMSEDFCGQSPSILVMQHFMYS